MNKTKKYKYLRKNRHSKRSKHSKHSKHGNKNKKTRKIQRGGQPLGSTLVHSGDRIGYTGTGTAAIQAQRLLSRNTPSNSLSEEEQKKENALRMKELKERYELEMEEYKRNKQADEEEAKRIAAAEKAAAAAVAKQEAAEAAAAAAAAAPVTNSPYSEDPDLKAAELEKAALQDSESKQKPSVNLPLVLDRVEAWGKETLIPGTTTAMDKDLEQEKRMVLIKVNPKANENIGNQIEHFTSENETLLAGLKSLDLDINGYESKLQLNEQLSEKEMDHLKELKEQKEQKELKMGSNTNQINELRVILGDNPTEDLGPSYNPMMVPGQEISSQHNTHRTAHMPPPIRQRIPAAAPAAAAETKAAAAAEKAQPSRPPVPTTRPPPLVPTAAAATKIDAEKPASATSPVETPAAAAAVPFTTYNKRQKYRIDSAKQRLQQTLEKAGTATRKIFSKKSPEEVAAAAQAKAAAEQAKAARRAKAQDLKAAQIEQEKAAGLKRGKGIVGKASGSFKNTVMSLKKTLTTNPFNKTPKKTDPENTSESEPLLGDSSRSNDSNDSATQKKSWRESASARLKTAKNAVISTKNALLNRITRKKRDTQNPEGSTIEMQEMQEMKADSSQPTSSANSSQTPPSPAEVATPYNPAAPTRAPPPPPTRPSPPLSAEVATPYNPDIAPRKAPPPPPPRPSPPLSAEEATPPPKADAVSPPTRPTPPPIAPRSYSSSQAVPGAQSAGNITRKNRQYIHEIKDNRTHIFNKEMEIINSIRNFKHGHNHGHGPNEHGKNKPENIQKKFIKVIKRS